MSPKPAPVDAPPPPCTSAAAMGVMRSEDGRSHAATLCNHSLVKPALSAASTSSAQWEAGATPRASQGAGSGARPSRSMDCMTAAMEAIAAGSRAAMLRAMVDGVHGSPPAPLPAEAAESSSSSPVTATRQGRTATQMGGGAGGDTTTPAAVAAATIASGVRALLVGVAVAAATTSPATRSRCTLPRKMGAGTLTSRTRLPTSSGRFCARVASAHEEPWPAVCDRGAVA